MTSERVFEKVVHYQGGGFWRWQPTAWDAAFGALDTFAAWQASSHEGYQTVAGYRWALLLIVLLPPLTHHIATSLITKKHCHLQ